MIDKTKRRMKRVIMIQLIGLLVFELLFITFFVFVCLFFNISLTAKLTCIILGVAVIYGFIQIIYNLTDYRALKNNSLNHFTGKIIDITVYTYWNGNYRPTLTHVFRDTQNNEYKLVIDGFENKRIECDSEEEFTVYYTKTTKIGFIPELTTKK